MLIQYIRDAHYGGQSDRLADLEIFWLSKSEGRDILIPIYERNKMKPQIYNINTEIQ
jgi:hypothetical protein